MSSYLQVTLEHVQQYVLYRQVSGAANADNSAMKKGKMMSEAAVQALSVHRNKDEAKGYPVFFTGIVGAAMKKHVSYNMKLTLNAQYGAVKNAHCECGAGAKSNIYD
jgi:hypothetical protein